MESKKLKRGLLAIIFIIILGFNLMANDKVILAEIPANNILLKDVIERVNTLPEMHRVRYKSVEGLTEVLDMMVVETTFLKKAKELGIDKNEEVLQAIEQNLRPVVSQIYYDELMDKEGRITTKDVENYYKANRLNFMVLPRVSIQHMEVSRHSLPEVKEKIEAGENFEELIAKYSINEQTKANKGIIREIRMNGFFVGIGHDQQLNRYIADASIDTEIVSGPFETETGIHFFKKLSFEPSVIKPFEDVEYEIEKHLTVEKENKIFQNLIAQMKKKYNVVYHYDRLENLNINNIVFEQTGIVIVESKHPEIGIVFNDAARLIRRVAMQERFDATSKHLQESTITREIETQIFAVAAKDAKVLERHKNSFEVQQVYTSQILNYYYRTTIAEQVKISDDELLAFYQENTERFTTPASRNVRQFVAKDEKTAKKHHKTVQKHLKKNEEAKIIDLIQKESLKKDNDGVIINIYKNNIIPGIGVDETYNAKVWEQKLNELGGIFKNKDGEIVFFYVMKETDPVVRPLAEVEENLKGQLFRTKSNELFQQRKQELVDEYGVVVHYERLKSMVTPEELFTLAEEAQKRFSFDEAISYYNQIIAENPNSVHEYRAMFMRAFVTGEDKKETDKAINLFEEFLSKYPEGDLNESAEFMLEALKSDVSIEAILEGK